MRRFMLSLCALSLLGAMVGCKGTRWRGACDCEFDDHCCTRQPWVSQSPPGGIFVAPPAGSVVSPAPVHHGAPAPMMPPGETSATIRSFPHGN